MLTFDVATPHSGGGGVNWDLVFVIIASLSAVAVAMFTALAYRLGRRDARRRERTLHKFPLVEIFQMWLEVQGDSTLTGFQIRLFFQNTHDEPLRYEMEAFRVSSVDEKPQNVSPESKEGTTGGVVAPGLREAFTSNPSGLFLIEKAPHFALVEFSIKYGAVRAHDKFAFEWREKRQLIATLSRPVSPSATLESIPFTWQGAAETERLKAKRWR